MSANGHRAFAHLVDAHFAGTIAPAQERALRAHLPDCPACRRRYERRLVLEQLDPRAIGAEARLAVGLGLRGERSGTAASARAGGWLMGATALALLALAMWAPTWRSLLRAGDAEFAARGARPWSASDTPRLLIYRLRAQRSAGSAEVVHDVIGPDDELAFAYTNPSASGYEHLLIFGTDEHGHVYWYHPAWTDARANPSAISVAKGAELHELTEAVRQPLDGRELHIVAVFTHDNISVKEVEGLMRHAPGNRLDVRGAMPDAVEVRTTLRVER